MKSIRNCPVCLSDQKENLHSLTLTYGGEQWVVGCKDCGMVYASFFTVVNYDEESIYSVPGATGSGDRPQDAARMETISQFIEDLRISKSASILDIGCAQGGLLRKLRERGFKNLNGIDPSKACATEAADRGLNVRHGTISDPDEKYDIVILSHVLEHLSDVRQSLRDVKRRINKSGLAYIEVPEATRYAEYNAPFLDFNSEHINHFGESTLRLAIESSGLQVLSFGRKLVPLPERSNYPAMWVVASHTCHQTVYSIKNYVRKSKEQLERVNQYLERELDGVPEVVIWGVNSYCDNILSLPVFQRVKAAQAVDRNRALWGKSTRGVTVEPTANVRHDLPIVIASLFAIESIKDDIRDMGLPNRVVCIREEVYE
jgi:SAM-dependent methyltransferase